jgi:hypothetical protein
MIVIDLIVSFGGNGALQVHTRRKLLRVSQRFNSLSSLVSSQFTFLSAHPPKDPHIENPRQLSSQDGHSAFSSSTGLTRVHQSGCRPVPPRVECELVSPNRVARFAAVLICFCVRTRWKALSFGLDAMFAAADLPKLLADPFTQVR